jgi:hypothetical protein
MFNPPQAVKAEGCDCVPVDLHMIVSGPLFSCPNYREKRF